MGQTKGNIRRWALQGAVTALACHAHVAVAQAPGSLTLDRVRLVQLTGDTALRITRPVHRVLSTGAVSITALMPQVLHTWNSTIPFSLNDGVLWAGKGHNASVTGGAHIELRTGAVAVRVDVAPALAYSQNLPFQVVPFPTTARSTFASPFHTGLFSIDMPQRFGDRHLLQVDPGESGIAIEVRGVEAGATSRQARWGPGVRNQLVLSANAPGIPRVYLRTARPLRSPAGRFDAEVFGGVLTESRFFDYTADNDLQSLSGLRLAWSPPSDSSLTIGLARLVLAPMNRSDGAARVAASRLFDGVRIWQRLALLDDTLPSGAPRQRTDQVTSLFARWNVPASGLEVYGEWARVDLPGTFSELATALHQAFGYTVGMQWALPRASGSWLRAQVEFTNLEQTRVLLGRPVGEFYSARVARQGFTQRGQVIGAATGPGSSSQFIAVDHVARAWQAGGYIGRIRWDNDAMYRLSLPTPFRHDVTAYGGARGAVRTAWADVSLDIAFGYRFNFMFQNGFAEIGGLGTVDERNLTMTMSLVPRRWR